MLRDGHHRNVRDDTSSALSSALSGALSAYVPVANDTRRPSSGPHSAQPRTGGRPRAPSSLRWADRRRACPDSDGLAMCLARRPFKLEGRDLHRPGEPSLDGRASDGDRVIIKSQLSAFLGIPSPYHRCACLSASISDRPTIRVPPGAPIPGPWIRRPGQAQAGPCERAGPASSRAWPVTARAPDQSRRSLGPVEIQRQAATNAARSSTPPSPAPARDSSARPFRSPTTRVE